MSAVLTLDLDLDFELASGHGPDEDEPRLAGWPKRLTLDDVIVGVWEGVEAGRDVSCPACGSTMAPRYASGSKPVGGRCRDCGTTLD